MRNTLIQWIAILSISMMINCAENITSTTDVEGNKYKTIKIGNQWWMAENLRVTHYRNGDPIKEIKDATSWGACTTGAYCAYDNKKENANDFGYLYNWYALKDSRTIAPPGWHVPTDEEWQELVDYLGGDTVAGGKLKESGYAHWPHPNVGATNESGFTALAAGFRYHLGYFSDLYNTATFWSSTEKDSTKAWCRKLYFEHPSVVREGLLGKRSGFSVRCIKD